MFITMIYLKNLKKGNVYSSLKLSKDVLWKHPSYRCIFFHILSFSAGFWCVSLCGPYDTSHPFLKYVWGPQSGACCRSRLSPPGAGALPSGAPALGPGAQHFPGRADPVGLMPRSVTHSSTQLSWGEASDRGLLSELPLTRPGTAFIPGNVMKPLSNSDEDYAC